MTDPGASAQDDATTSDSQPSGPVDPRRLPDPEDRGSLTIADRVIETVAAMAAREIDAVIAQTSGWRRMTGRPVPRATATIAGGRSRIGVDITTSWPTPLPEVASRTRDHVRERVTALTGTDVVAVDVTVSAIVHRHPERQRVT